MREQEELGRRGSKDDFLLTVYEGAKLKRLLPPLAEDVTGVACQGGIRISFRLDAFRM